MLATQTVDLSTLPEAERFGSWLDLVAREAAPAQIYSPQADNFNAWCRVIELGVLRLTSFRYPSLIARRTPRMVRQSDPELYQLSFPTNGRSAIAQERRESALEPADFTLLNTSHPYDASHSPGTSDQEFASSITVLIPQAMLPLPADRVSQLFATRIPSGTGMGALLAPYLLHLAEHPEQYQPSETMQLGSTALDLISATLAQQLDALSILPGEVQHRALRARIDTFIDEYLGDPELSPRMVAAAHHISIRTLHRLFQAEVPIAELIRTRRLHRCRRDLTNPLLRGHPIYAIANRWGFADNAHFSRLFRATFGISPQAYRGQ